MSIQDGSIDFQLTRPLKYKFDGGTHEATYVKLQEPGMEHSKFYRKLKQMFTQASTDYAERFPEIKEASESAAGEDIKPLHEQKEKSEQVVDAEAAFVSGMLQMSNSIDYSHFCDVFEKMMCVRNPSKAICMIDGRYSMNDNLLKGVHPDDVEDMAVRWFIFFATPSEEGRKTSSEQPSTSQPQPMEA
jgi:hypothetical protein